jgi:DNA invertase Pin-like site-specific DNA recombinase
MRKLDSDKKGLSSVVAFYRVSNKKQDVERQKIDIANYCKAFSYNIINEFVEQISGASKLADRTDLMKCMDYVYDNKPDIFIVSELSRLGRTYDLLTITKKLKELGICFISIKDSLKTIDIDTTTGEKKPNAITDLLIGVLTAVNQFELSTISYRITSGRNNKVLNSGSFGGGANVPYGYRVDDKKLVIDAEEAVIIKDIFDKCLNGWGTVRIANYLNQNDIQTRLAKSGKKQTKWAKKTIYNILQNTLYIGKRKWDGDIIDAEYLRIIDDETFNLVNEKLNINKNFNFDFNKQKKYNYLLDEKILKCSCGKHFIGIDRTKSYKCISGKYSKGCGRKIINMPLLDREVSMFVNKWLFDTKNLEMYVNTGNAETITNEKTLIDLNKELEKLNRKRKKYLDMFSDELINKSQLNEYLKNIDNNIDNYRVKVDNIEREINENKNVNRDIKEILEDLKKNRVTTTTDKELLHKVVKFINIDGEIMTIHFINSETKTVDLRKK